MKKSLLTLTLLAAFGFSKAQEIKTNAGTFTKPQGGEIIMEINFSPDLTGNPAIFSLPTLSDDMDLVGIKARKFLSETKAYRAIANLSISNSGEEDAETSFSLGAGFGIENHMKGAERLSTYWGYEGKLGFVKALDEEIGLETTKFGIAGNIFTGFDYYIVPNIYLGAEVSYGLAVTNKKPDGGDGETKFELAPGVTPTFRLGWRF
jgi:hypothetical protein|tara:strand:+ start:280 stop:897 length:618 start_codon:yes stop_codon:yes gene_type:complete